VIVGPFGQFPFHNSGETWFTAGLLLVYGWLGVPSWVSSQTKYRQPAQKLTHHLIGSGSLNAGQIAHLPPPLKQPWWSTSLYVETINLKWPDPGAKKQFQYTEEGGCL